MPEVLGEMVHHAPSELLGQLKAISTALAPLGRGATGSALFHFDFTPDAPMEMMPDPLDFLLPDEEKEEMADMEQEMLTQMMLYVMSLEMIDKNSSRADKINAIKQTNIISEMLELDSLPFHYVVQARNELLQHIPPLKESARKFVSHLDSSLINQLSKGAHIFLTGKKKS